MDKRLVMLMVVCGLWVGFNCGNTPAGAQPVSEMALLTKEMRDLRLEVRSLKDMMKRNNTGLALNADRSRHLKSSLDNARRSFDKSR